MIIVVTVVCVIIFLLCRLGDNVFGEFMGVLMTIAFFGLCIIGVLFLIGSFLLPVLAALVVPAIGIWLVFKIVTSMLCSDAK